jgi:tRNA 2-thiouridine synthesizing protein C
VWITAAPYASTRARAGLDTALAFAAFGQPVALLLSGPGVLALPPRTGHPEHATPSLRKLIDSLPLYDIETLWVDAASLEEHGVAASSLPAFVRPIGPDQRRRLLAEASAVYSY